MKTIPGYGNVNSFSFLVDDQPLTKLASKVPKNLNIDLMDLADNIKATEKRKPTSKLKTSPAKKTKTKKDLAQPSASSTKIDKKKKGRCCFCCIMPIGLNYYEKL